MPSAKHQHIGEFLLKLVILITALGAAVAVQATATDSTPAPSAAEEGKYRFTVDINPGEHYSHWKWFGIWPVKLTPQIAVWIETADGMFVDTIYSTRSNGENSWRGADQRPEDRVGGGVTPAVLSQNRAYGSVHGSSRKAYSLLN